MKSEAKAKDNRGGRREGAGRLPKYGEPTATLCFRVPQTSREKITAMVRDYLETLKLEHITNKREPEYGC